MVCLISWTREENQKTATKEGEDKTEQEDIMCRSEIGFKIIEIKFLLSGIAKL